MHRGLSSGFRVGHFTNAGGETGCTVILPPLGNVCSHGLRGSSPGSRELASLDLDRRATEVQGILLTGGSAVGLAGRLKCEALDWHQAGCAPGLPFTSPSFSTKVDRVQNNLTNMGAAPPGVHCSAGSPAGEKSRDKARLGRRSISLRQALVAIS